MIASAATEGNLAERLRLLRRYALALAILFTLCAAVLFARTLWRQRHAQLDDFGTVYAASRCWINAQNPYETNGVVQAFRSAGGPADVPSGTVLRPSVYLLPAMPLFALVSSEPWNVTRTLCIVLCTISFFAAVFTVSRHLPLPPFAQVFAAGLAILLCKPFFVGMWFGNPSLIVLGLITVGASLLVRGKPVVSGILLGLALAIKPQLAVGLLIAACLAKRWTTVSAAAAVLAASSAVAAFRAGSLPVLQLWLNTQRQNLALSLAPGHINDPGFASQYGYQFLNVQTLAGVFTSNATTRNAIAWAVCALLIAVYIKVRANVPQPGFWTDFSFFTIVLLLPAYHRNYDGEIFIVLLPWLASAFRQRRLWPAAIGSLGVFLLLSGSFFWALHFTGSDLANGSVLRALLLRHQAIVTLALASLVAVYSHRPAAQLHRAKLT